MIIETVNFSRFCEAFNGMGRKDHFSYEAKKALFDYLEETSDETGEPIELDVIALCCEYVEMTPEEVQQAYPDDIEIEEGEDVDEDKVEEYLSNNTIVVGHGAGTIVFAQF